MKSSGKRTALYARVSTDSQTTANQLRELRAAAERHGWIIVAEFVDHGVSGAKGRQERQQFDALLRGVARREFDMIAAWSGQNRPDARHWRERRAASTRVTNRATRIASGAGGAQESLAAR